MTAQMANSAAVFSVSTNRLAFQRADAERRERRHAGGQKADRQQLAAAAHAAQQQDRAGRRRQQHDRVRQRVAQRDDADQRDRRREQQRNFLLVRDRHRHAEQHQRNQLGSPIVVAREHHQRHRDDDERQQRRQPAEIVDDPRLAVINVKAAQHVQRDVHAEHGQRARWLWPRTAAERARPGIPVVAFRSVVSLIGTRIAVFVLGVGQHRAGRNHLRLFRRRRRPRRSAASRVASTLSFSVVRQLRDVKRGKYPVGDVRRGILLQRLLQRGGRILDQHVADRHVLLETGLRADAANRDRFRVGVVLRRQLFQ